MPGQCACCGSESAASTAAATHVHGARVVRTETGTWSIPYCSRCAKHVDRWPAFDADRVLLLTLVTLGLFFLYYLHRRYSARAACAKWCCRPGPAVKYLGWHGSRHDFEIASRSFTRAFVAANRKKISWADREAQSIIDELDAEGPSAREAHPGPAPQDLGIEEGTRAVPRTRRDGDPNPSPRGFGYELRLVPSPAAAPSTRVVGTSRFVGLGMRIEVAGRQLDSPLVYVAPTTAAIDASTVVTSLPVGRAERALPLTYWPSYFEASPDQRARYLDWLAAGRRDHEIDVGYLFMTFYGFERRALLDEADHEAVVAEVQRLLEERGSSEPSFLGYATSFLAFTTWRRLERVQDRELDQCVGRFARINPDAFTVLLAAHTQQCKPLSAKHAADVVASFAGANRGVVAERAGTELANLFAIRYRDQFGDGLVPIAAKRSTTLKYRPASATLARSGLRLTATLPDAIGRPAQFRPLIDIWNACVEDLRKLSATRRRSGAEILTAEAWTALPLELRREIDHPDRARWNEVISSAPKIGDVHIVTGVALKALVGQSETDKITSAQLKRIGDTAAILGFAMEPEPRLYGRAATDETEFAVWRSGNTSCPEKATYEAAAGLLSLGLAVALSDGIAKEEELEVVTQLLNEMVPVDEVLRNRLQALRTILVRQPDRVTTVARRLQGTRSSADRAKIGRVLVLVAAADGILEVAEHKALRAVYRALGLSAADLDAAMVACDLRLASDAPVLVDGGATRTDGEVIPRPPEAVGKRPDVVTLDHAAIASIMAETREVATMLAAVLGGSHEDESPPEGSSIAKFGSEARQDGRSPLPPELAIAATTLDPRYHLALSELVTKAEWNASEVRALGARLKLMPGGLIEVINSWSDEHLGDYLIEEQGDWHVRIDLLRRLDA
jgi:tellurite resistance protein